MLIRIDTCVSGCAGVNGQCSSPEPVALHCA